MPEAIERHLLASLSDELAALGVTGAKVDVLSARADDWRFRIEAGGRRFETGYSQREQLWCREITPGREASLFSNDEPQIGTSVAARLAVVRRIQRALQNPESIRRDPPPI